MPKLAANISMMFTELPFLDRIDASAAAGFKAVEFLFPYDYPAGDIAARLKSNGVANVLFNAPPGNWAQGERGIAALPGREQEFRDGIEQALAYAKVLGTPNIHVMAGIIAADVDTEECLAVYRQNLKHAAVRCEAQGLNVLIEPINNRDMPGYLLNRQAQAHQIRQAVAAPNLKVQMDFYHAQIMEGDIAMTFRKYQAHVGHIQIAGVPERHEPDTGEVNYAWLFRLLDDLGYDGWVGCEYRPAGNTQEGLGWIDRLAARQAELAA